MASGSAGLREGSPSEAAEGLRSDSQEFSPFDKADLGRFIDLNVSSSLGGDVTRSFSDDRSDHNRWRSPDAEGNAPREEEEKLRIMGTPLWYERYSSFVSDVNPSEFLPTLTAMLDGDMRVDYIVCATSYRIVGTVYLRERGVQFHINLFKHNEEEYLVEFQRRSGCVVDFQTFYRQCLASLGKLDLSTVHSIKTAGMLNLHKCHTSARSTDSVAATTTSAESEEKAQKQDGLLSSLEARKDDLRSPLLDVRNEALRSVMLISEHADPSCIGKHDAITTSLLSAMDGISGDSEMSRCVAAILSNVCLSANGCRTDSDKHVDDLQKKVSADIVQPLLQFWSRSNTTPCCPSEREADRQIARLLDILYNGDRDRVGEYALSSEKAKAMIDVIEKREKEMDVRVSEKYSSMKHAMNSVVRQLASVLV